MSLVCNVLAFQVHGLNNRRRGEKAMKLSKAPSSKTKKDYFNEVLCFLCCVLVSFSFLFCIAG